MLAMLELRSSVAIALGGWHERGIILQQQVRDAGERRRKAIEDEEKRKQDALAEEAARIAEEEARKHEKERRERSRRRRAREQAKSEALEAERIRSAEYLALIDEIDRLQREINEEFRRERARLEVETKRRIETTKMRRKRIAQAMILLLSEV